MDFVNSFISYRGKSGVPITSRHAERQLRTLTTKQSPFGPHETTLWNEGSSNILILIEQISAGMKDEGILVELLDEVRCWRHVILRLLLGFRL